MKTLEFKDLNDIDKKLGTDQRCRDYFEFIRWGGEVCCPHCGDTKYYTLARTKQNMYKCAGCMMRFNCLTGTIFENTKISLLVWYKAIHLTTNLSKGISSVNLAKMLGITQKSAWFMLQRIREMMQVEQSQMQGITEADETFIGGKEGNKHASKRLGIGAGSAGKVPVMGVVERGGKLFCMPVPAIDGKYVLPVITAIVKPGSTVYTDQYVPYKGLKANYNHGSVNHSIGEYTNGVIHTGTIDGAWSLLKRKIIGIHHFVSPKHLHRYCNEFMFSYNTKGISQFDRLNLALRGATNYRLLYKVLIADPKNNSK